MSHDPNCFGCSASNPLGLKVKFRIKDDCVFGEFNSNHNHIGPPGIIHGGVIATLIDEAMAYAVVHLSKQNPRTVKEEIVFRNPAKAGDRIYVQARLKEEKSRAVMVVAKVYSDTATIAEGTGMLFKVNEAQTYETK
ncbi:PaaI family thioesterase [Candidatus Omnitrophota bacterium]